MQKLSVELKNTPRNAPQVPCSVSNTLNRVEKLGVCSKVLADNNPEVDLPENTQGRKDNYVFVISCCGFPLMPCKPAKARKLLKRKDAIVIKKYPFTIQLNFECENVVQEVKLGIDTGFGNIGFSAITNNKELICGTLKLDGKTSERLNNRKMYRRGKRSRHHWYRKPRFLNRSIPIGWLPPSIQRRYDTHLNTINRLKRILPISEVIVEVAKFDIQKIENPDIQGKDYQQGDLYEYQNMRSYLMTREKGKCQLCNKDFKHQPSHIHHIEPRSRGGTNRPSNLAILHKSCHEKLHKQNLKLSKAKSYKPNTFMSIINKRFYKDIPDLKVTYGNITFVNRNKINLEKTHYNDAFIIVGGSEQERINPIEIIQKHRNNRCIQLNRKGYKPSIRKNRYKFQPKDLVWIGNKKYVVKGVHGYGKQIKVERNGVNYNFSINKIEKYFLFGSLVWQNSSKR